MLGLEAEAVVLAKDDALIAGQDPVQADCGSSQ